MVHRDSHLLTSDGSMRGDFLDWFIQFGLPPSLGGEKLQPAERR